MKKPFYHSTIRKIVISFGSLFNELQIEREDSNGVFKEINIPIIYTTKEKFVTRIQQVSDQITSDDPIIEEYLPKMAYEITSLSYDPSRKTNTLEKIRGENDELFVFNKVPYTLTFSLYIATRKIDDSLRIIEQILPYFTPEIVLKIKDLNELQLETNVPIVLSGTNFEIDSEGSFDDRRVVFWSLDFSVDFYLYAAIRDSAIIKKTTIDINNINTNKLFEQYLAEIDPLSANSTDNYIIKETIKNV
jgi:hypothetical protein